MNKMQLQLVSLLIAATLTTAATGQDNSLYDGPIIDMHMHASNIQIGPDGKPVAVPLRCYPGPCEGGPAAATTEDEVLQMTLAAMDRHNIVLVSTDKNN